MTTKQLRLIVPLFTLAIFAVMLWVLYQQLAELDWPAVGRRLLATPGPQLAVVLGLTALAYAVLPAYDFLGLRYVGRKVAAGRVMLVALLSYVFSNNVGFLGLSGGAVRLRHYTGHGLTAGEACKLTAFNTSSFWLGLLALAGLTFLVFPLPLPESPYIPLRSMWPLGTAFLAVVGAYLLTCAVRKQPLRFGKCEIALPPLRLALGQFAVGSVDWLLAAAALYALMPDWAAQSFPTFFSIFLLAQVVALVSHVPGGLGVFETVMVLLLKPMVHPDAAIGALFVYRVAYYLLPLAIGSLAMGGYEAVRYRDRIRSVGRAYTRWAGLVAPDLLAVLTCAGGVALLLFGAAPTLAQQLRWICVLAPLPLVEVSPFAASLAGVALLLLARGLQRRFDAAYWSTAALLGVGVAAALCKGPDFGEAGVLAVFLAALLPCRREFYRRASLFTDRFRPVWIFGIGVVLLALVGLALFTCADPKDCLQTWWQFELSGSAPWLRLAVGACVVVLVLVGRQMLRPAARKHPTPEPADVEQAGAVAGRSPDTYSYLALLGDKALHFNAKRTGFVMYAPSGRSWVAMGDPVGPAGAVGELAHEFHERCSHAGGRTVFYQVHPSNLQVYVDMGLSLIKIGEEGRVPLKGFSLTGRARKNLRHMLNKAKDAGYSFRMAPAEEVAGLMPELRAISDAWLAERKLKEKGFSLGFFDEAYLTQFPVALVEQDGELVAFANLWPGADRVELSIDLMRHRPAASNGVMDMLFIELMLWGAAEGYAWFNLGMAPLSGLADGNHAPLWSRFGAMVYQHGENFYNFQGLRRFKEKFDPVWEPRYLASPGGLALPRVLADVTALIRRGTRGRKGAPSSARPAVAVAAESADPLTEAAAVPALPRPPTALRPAAMGKA